MHTNLSRFCCSASWMSDTMAVLSTFVPLALLLRLLLLLLLLFDRLSISLLLLIGDGTCWWWLCCGCCSWCKLLWLFCWWLLFVTWIEWAKKRIHTQKSFQRYHTQIFVGLSQQTVDQNKAKNMNGKNGQLTGWEHLHEILGNVLVNDGAWNFAEYKAKCVAVGETLQQSKSKQINQLEKWKERVFFFKHSWCGTWICLSNADKIAPGAPTRWGAIESGVIFWVTFQMSVWRKSDSETFIEMCKNARQSVNKVWNNWP